MNLLARRDFLDYYKHLLSEDDIVIVISVDACTSLHRGPPVPPLTVRKTKNLLSDNVISFLHDTLKHLIVDFLRMPHRNRLKLRETSQKILEFVNKRLGTERYVTFDNYSLSELGRDYTLNNCSVLHDNFNLVFVRPFNIPSIT